MMLVPPSGTTVLDVRDLAELLAGSRPPTSTFPRASPVATSSRGAVVSALERAVGRPVAHQVVTHEEILASP